jgi:hypothetical protein
MAWPFVRRGLRTLEVSDGEISPPRCGGEAKGHCNSTSSSGLNRLSCSARSAWGRILNSSGMLSASTGRIFLSVVLGSFVYNATTFLMGGAASNAAPQVDF